MKGRNLLRIALLLLALPGLVPAAIMTFSPTPADLEDLDHGTVWTWRIDNINLGGHGIESASLTIAGIYNWADEPNRLFIHLLDTAANAGTAKRSDPASGIADYFLKPSLSFAPAYGTSNVLLTSQSFAGGQANKIDYTYLFTAQQLAILQSFIMHNGDVAIGFDPDCHFYNSGITFQLATTHSPEPGTYLLVGICLLIGVPAIRHVRRRRPD